MVRKIDVESLDFRECVRTVIKGTEGIVVLFHAVNVCGRVEVQKHSFLTYAVGEGCSRTHVTVG
jgi:hypothetical protein